MSTLTFYRRVIEETGQADRAAVKRGTAAVLHALRDRLMPTEAPPRPSRSCRELKAVWRAGEIPNRTPVKMHRKQLYERVMREARLQNVREARFLTIGVFAALKAQLSPGEADDVRAQLPRDLQHVWEDA